MTEPTRELEDAFADAAHLDPELHDVTRDQVRAGLAAALAIVERDYVLSKACPVELAPGIRCKLPDGHMVDGHLVHEHEGLTPNGNRVKWAELP